MYHNDLSALQGVLYNFVRFVLPIFIAQCLPIPFLKKRPYWIPLFLTSSLLYFSVSFAIIYFQVDFSIDWFSLSFAIIFIISSLPIISSMDISIKKLIFFSIAAYAIQNLSDNLASLFLRLSNEAFFTVAGILIFVACYLFTFSLHFLVFIRRIKNDTLNTMDNKVLIFSLGIALLVVYVLSMLGQATNEYLPFVAIKCYAIISCLFILITQFNNFHANKLKDENVILEKILHKENEKFREYKSNIDIINMRCHDLKHQIISLQSQVSTEKEREKLKDLEKGIEIFDSRIKTGNVTLDALISEKSLYCKQHGIRFSFIADGEKLNFVENIDIYSMFGNALDNAIEAVEKLEEELRTITVNVKETNGLVVIHVVNNFLGKIDFKNGIPLTNKIESWHGYGSKSINYVAKKYNGKAIFKAKDNVFTLNICLPIPN